MLERIIPEAEDNALRRNNLDRIEVIERARKPREYTRDEIDRLYDEVEKAVINDRALDFHKIADVLLPSDFTLVGLGANVDIETMFEVTGLRWEYEGEIFSARISPRARRGGIPGVDWYVSMTVCESGRYAGATWDRTYMLRKNYRKYSSDMKNGENE